MKKLMILLVASISLCCQAQNIERKTELDGGILSVTSAEKLFSGCKMRLCHFVSKEDNLYGLELDLTDRVRSVSKGNLLTITFRDESTIVLENLYDTQAEVTVERSVESRTEFGTTFVSGYDPWFGVFYSEPVRTAYTADVPVMRTSTFASLYYLITPQQIKKIINGKVSNIQIVTDSETICKKARPISDNFELLYSLFKK